MINKKIAIILAGFIFVVALAASYFLFSNKNIGFGFMPSSSKYQAPVVTGAAGGDAESKEPKTEECPLSGEKLSKTARSKWESRRPLGVMIENHTDARPQSGLSSADNIYEAVAEGGITRFLAVFYCHETSFVGPVRSARMYFLRLLEGYGDYPLYAHVGGANTPGPANALGEIEDLHWGLYNDMNQFAVPFPNYWRDYDRLPGRVTEHTVYSSTEKLWQYAKINRKLTQVDNKGQHWDKKFTPWKFADGVDKSARGKVAKISLGFWNIFASDYSVVWNYDMVSNSYSRENGGKPHLDKNTNKQLTAKNIVVIFAKESPANDGYEGGHILYKLQSTGDGLLFQNGESQEITWKKPEETSLIRFYDKTGKEVSLVRGQVFVEILPIGNKVTY